MPKSVAAIILCLGAYFLAASAPARADNFTAEKRVFGVSLRWEAAQKNTSDALSKPIEKMSQEFSISHDPDCIWRSQVKGKCLNKYKAQTQEIEKLAEKMKTETLGYFDVKLSAANKSPNLQKRDFGGISQGYFLEKLAVKEKGNWLGDFAGDIFFTGGFIPSKPFTITDPLIDKGIYAKVNMNSGWMLSSTSKVLGANMRNPVDPEQKEEFLRVVLFAKKEFSGARIDAWSTAVQVGGHKVLDHLWTELPAYKGQWAYMYFAISGEVKCSENIKCHLNGPKERLVEISW